MQRRIFQILAVISLILAPAAAGRAQSMMDQIILQRCSATMQSDYQKAGQTPNAELISKTCSCVVKQVIATHSIDAAKAICTQQALTGS